MVNKIKLSEIQLVPEIQSLFPENSEYKAIKADIMERGIQDAVKVNAQNQLLCGYTRLKIASDLGLTEIPHMVISIDGDISTMMEYAILDNIRRRQLTDLQLVECGMKLEKLYEGRQGGDRGKNQYAEWQGGQNVPLDNGKTRDLVASQISKESNTKMSGKKYERLKKVAMKAAPEIKELVNKGELTQQAALEVVKLDSHDEQKAILSKLYGWMRSEYATRNSELRQ